MRYASNPLSEKRRIFLRERLLRHTELDEESKKSATPGQIEERTRILESILDMVHEADPSLTGEHAAWIIKLYLRNRIRLPEDTQKLKECLTAFSQNKHKYPAELRDLNQYEDFSSLARTIDEHSGLKSKAEELREKIQEGQKILFEGQSPEGDTYQVIEVTAPEAAARMARNTHWCIKDPKFADNYLDTSPLYFIDKNHRRYILAWSSCSKDLREFHRKFQTFIDEKVRLQKCILCSSEGRGNPTLCDQHQHWLVAISGAYHNYDRYISLMHIVDRAPKNVGELATQRVSEVRSDFLRGPGAEVGECQIMDVYDAPAELSDFEFDLVTRLFEHCGVDFLLDVVAHAADPEKILKFFEPHLAEMSPDKIIAVYCIYVLKHVVVISELLLDINIMGSALFDITIEKLRHYQRRDPNYAIQIQIQRWRAAETYLFLQPTAAFNYYQILRAAGKIKDDESDPILADFKKQISRPALKSPHYLGPHPPSHYVESDVESDAGTKLVELEYQRRLEKLKKWKQEAIEKRRRQVQKSWELFNKRLKRDSRHQISVQKLLTSWEKKILPQVEAGQTDFSAALQELVVKLFPQVGGLGASHARILEELLRPYVDHYGMGYVVVDGKPVSLQSYLKKLRRPLRQKRHAKMRESYRRRKQQAIKSLLSEVEDSYKKLIKKKRA